jgi:hypothetical protein
VPLKTCGCYPGTVALVAFLGWTRERWRFPLPQCSLATMVARWSRHYFCLEIDLVSTDPHLALSRLVRGSGLDLVFRSGLFVHLLHRGLAHAPNPYLASLPLTGFVA